MSYFIAALQAELLKIRQSNVIWITAIAFTLAPVMAGFFMFVLKDPNVAKSAGLLGAKAQIAGEANWPSYLNLYAQMIAVGGLLVFGFVTSWIFGREYSDKTAKDLLALPAPRAAIVTAKFAAAFMINILLTAYVVMLGFVIGWTLDLPQWSYQSIMHGLFVLSVVTVLTVLLSAPAAFFASSGRGFLAPLGFILLALVMSQFVAAAGFGAYFPWSIPALYSGIAGDENIPGINSLLIIGITCLLSFSATFYWWQYTDQH